MREFTIGLVVNPVSGMGGAVGLKGTDGEDTLRRAIALGATPRAPGRAAAFMSRLQPVARRLLVLTAPGEMGEGIVRASGGDVAIEVVGDPGTRDARTTREDTIAFVRAVMDRVQLLVFVGGDGTARDVLDALGQDASRVPVIGVPAGVKIHSSVFGVHPGDVALLVMKFLAGEIGTTTGEVMDINEDMFRNNRVESRLFGYLTVPCEPAYMQGSKQGSPVAASDEENKARIAAHVVAMMEPGTCYFVGPGSTTKPILDLLGLDKTLLGVDAVLGDTLVGKDLNEAGILALLERLGSSGTTAKIVMTVIGSQGFLFGRGNLQFSPSVIRRVGVENIIIVVTRHKHASLPGGVMRNDTGDPDLDDSMRGYYRVLVDEGEYKITRLA